MTKYIVSMKEYDYDDVKGTLFPEKSFDSEEGARYHITRFVTKLLLEQINKNKIPFDELDPEYRELFDEYHGERYFKKNPSLEMLTALCLHLYINGLNKRIFTWTIEKEVDVGGEDDYDDHPELNVPAETE
jgi:hypothetical protein